ncbi:MarR family transcriptional regulator [Nakamurella flavida]|uniref:MarR family transcriptional regulator n=1 Tax=Nakamurella flavida TaxID=363630 RepID=A0A939C269_9ACTN|nr:MarR family transcriptional regulator [Nakamurella flavida]MBM9476235.1 MarR family transcriptional regulator [Nakamurella flavida]MDP9779667.1 DNA-binding MarR family transcriptional regulator [Nakamurella flavida]
MSEHLLDRTVDPTALPEATGSCGCSIRPAPAGSGAMDEDTLHSEIAGAILSVVRQYAGIKARLVDTPEGEMHLSILLGKVTAHGPLRAGDLADRINADPSTVSRQVAALVKAGLLERRADPDDGRASLLVVTDAGRARLAEHEVRRGWATAPVLAGWSLHDRSELLRLMSRYALDLHDHRDEIVAMLTGAARAAAPTRSTGTEEDR